MCSKKETIILQWFTAVVKKDLKNLQDLKDGKILYNTLQTIKPIDYGSICGKPEEKSLSIVLNKLECRFRSKFDDISVDRAMSGDENELANIVMLVLVAGILSDNVQEFVAPIKNFHDATRTIIKELINVTVRPSMDLKERSLDQSFEACSSDGNHSFSSISPILHNNFKLSNFISPSFDPFTPIKDSSFNTKMMQTEQRLNNLTNKLKSEKSLRSEIQEELNQKDDEIERTRREVNELNERLKEMERRKNVVVEELKMQVTLLMKEKELVEEKIQEEHERETQKMRERKDLEERNIWLEKQNNEVFEEKNQLQEAHSKLSFKLKQITTLFKQNTHSNLQLQEEMKAKEEELEALNLKLLGVQKLYDEETEHLNDKLQVMTEKLNKSINMDEGECWGDVVEKMLKDEVEELKTSLQIKKEEFQEMKDENKNLGSQVASIQLTLQESVQKQTDMEMKMAVIENEKCALEEKVAKVSKINSEQALEYETRISERLENEQILMVKCEESDDLNKVKDEQIEMLEENCLQLKKESELHIITCLEENNLHLKELQDKYEESNLKICQLSILKDNLEQMKVELNAELKSSIVNFEMMKVKLSESEAGKKEMQCKMEAVQVENTSLMKTLREIKVKEIKLDDEIKENSMTINNLNIENVELISTNKSQDAKITKLYAEIDELSKDKLMQQSKLEECHKINMKLITDMDKLESDKVSLSARLGVMEAETMKLHEENMTVLQRVSDLEHDEMNLKKEVAEKNIVLKAKCEEYNEMVIMKNNLDEKVIDFNQLVLVMQKDIKNVLSEIEHMTLREVRLKGLVEEVEGANINLIRKVALLGEGESKLIEENKSLMSRIVSLQENEATLKENNDLMVGNELKMRELIKKDEKLKSKLTETQERLVVVEDEKILLRMTHENNQKEMKKQLDELTDALKKTMVHDSKHCLEDADDAVMKWTEMGAELEKGQQKLEQVVEAGALQKGASVFESLQQARQVTNVFVQLFDLLKQSHQLHKQELEFNEKEINEINQNGDVSGQEFTSKKVTQSSKNTPLLKTKRTRPSCSIVRSKVTRSRYAKKDGAWNNYGVLKAVDSKSLKADVVTYTSKTRPVLGEDRRITRVFKNRKKQESVVVVENSFVADKEQSTSRTPLPMPEGVARMLKCEDEPEQIDWGQLPSDSKGLKESSQIRDITDQNIFKKPYSVDVLSTQKQTGKKKLVSDSTVSRDTLFINQIPEQPEEDSSERISEIKRRNTLCLPHLRSTYPLEVLTNDPLPSPVQSPSDHQQSSTTALVKTRQSPRKRLRKTSHDSPSTKYVKTKKSSEQNNNASEDPTKNISSAGISLKGLLKKSVDKQLTPPDPSSVAQVLFAGSLSKRI